MADVSHNSSGEDRYCPTCGRTTSASHCPDDGVATVSWTAFNKSPGAYKPGDLIGDRYRIETILGRGGYGSVFAAVHTGTRQRVAVKMLDFDPREAGEVVLRRFYKEAQVTAGLHHANTVRVFDVGQDEGGPFYIAMELIDGPTLAEVMRAAILGGRAMPERQAIDVCCAILRSLQEAHDHRLVHRDLKPANIMFAKVAGETVVKVLDFGIARTLGSSLTGSGIAPGTPVYMSPEQCVGSDVDARADVYAVGIMLYLCTTGRLPFHSKNVLEMMRMHRHEPVPDPRGRTSQPLSEATVVAALRALEKEPARRFQTASAMREALEQAKAALPEERAGEFPPASLEKDPGTLKTSLAPRPSGDQRADDDERTAALPGKASGRHGAGSSPVRAPTPVDRAPPSTLKAPPSSVSSPASAASSAARRSSAAGSPPTRPTVLLHLLALVAGAALGAGVVWGLSPPPASPPPPVCPEAPAEPAAAMEAPAQAEIVARIARADGPLRQRLALARAAARLDPSNERHRRLLAELEEVARRVQAADRAAASPGVDPGLSPPPAPPPARHPPKKPPAPSGRRGEAGPGPAIIE